MAVHGEAVHAERIGDEVEVLAQVADGVGSAEEERVVERPVDGLDVVAPSVQALEVGIDEAVLERMRARFGIAAPVLATSGEDERWAA